MLNLKIKYYDNWARIPMLICFYVGAFLIGSSLFSAAKVLSSTGGYGDTDYLAPYFYGGLFFLALFVVFKILNIYIHKKEVNEALDEIEFELNKKYNLLIEKDIPPDVAKKILLSMLKERLDDGDIPVDAYTELCCFVINEC